MLINRDWWEGETCCWSIVLAATYSSLNTCFCMYKESVMYSPPNLAVLKSKWHTMSVGSCFFWWFLNSKTNAFNVKNKHLCKLQPHITKIFKFKEKQLLPNYGYVRLWTWLKLINHARFHSMFTKYEDNTEKVWFTDIEQSDHAITQLYSSIFILPEDTLLILTSTGNCLPSDTCKQTKVFRITHFWRCTIIQKRKYQYDRPCLNLYHVTCNSQSGST